MKAAAYRDIPAREVPVVALPQGGSARVIAGQLAVDGTQTSGPVNGNSDQHSTRHRSTSMCTCRRMRNSLRPSRPATTPSSTPTRAKARLGPADNDKPLPHRAAGVLSDGDTVRVQAGKDGTRFLLASRRSRCANRLSNTGRSCMNTREEIEQALARLSGRTLGRGLRADSPA